MRPICGMLLILGLAGLSAPCAAAPPSDSLTVAELRVAIEQRSWVRVTSSWGAARIIRPRVTATDLGYSEARPEEADLRSLPNPIPLAQIYRIEVPVNGCGRGAITGGIVGAIVGALTAQAVSNMSPIFPSREPESNHTGDIVRGAVLGAVSGALLGALVGSGFRDLKQVYPPDPLLDRPAR